MIFMVSVSLQPNSKRTRRFHRVTHSWLRLKPLQTTIYNDLHKFCTTRATTCPIHALLKQNIIVGSHITSCHRYVLQEQLVVLEETQILSLIHHLVEKGKGNGVSHQCSVSVPPHLKTKPLQAMLLIISTY